MDPKVDIKENDIFELSPELLNTLLKDHTLSTDECQVNIFWATDSYSSRGTGYQYADQITIDSIAGDNGNVIVPRAVKSRQEQQQRSREMAEVFTPSWICNKQNNLVDNAWFGREGVFNTEVDNPDGFHSWIVNTESIFFPEGKTWCDYVNENRLEITCGEAPYLVSRYDTVTGEPIPVERRIGILDRKLRVVNENIQTVDEWLKWSQTAFQSTYGYEWQGDNIVLAREALLYTFIDYYRVKFGGDPQIKSLLNIADIISWNIWQMDGLKGVVPNSCHSITTTDQNLFGENETIKKCEGCRHNNLHLHNGVYCKIRDWKENEVLTFASLIKRK
ncbi:MAG: restriction endonuclease subunit M [Muribaculaceae bacterium]|nr:restriction endonuclease subunit M [Muribaculaceae bacterium]